MERGERSWNSPTRHCTQGRNARRPGELAESSQRRHQQVRRRLLAVLVFTSQSRQTFVITGMILNVLLINTTDDSGMLCLETVNIQVIQIHVHRDIPIRKIVSCRGH